MAVDPTASWRVVGVCGLEVLFVTVGALSSSLKRATRQTVPEEEIIVWAPTSNVTLGLASSSSRPSCAIIDGVVLKVATTMGS